MDRAERGGLLAAELLLEPGHRARHDHDLVLQAPSCVQRPRDVVRREDVEIELLDPALTERREHLAHELRPDAAATRVTRDVEIRERPEPRRAALGEREADGRSVVVLGDERDLGRR